MRGPGEALSVTSGSAANPNPAPALPAIRRDLPLALRSAPGAASDPSLELAARLGLRQPPQYLSSEQMRTLIDGIRRPRTRLLVELLYQTGARISEAIAILGSDIDLENRRVRIRTLKRRGVCRGKPRVTYRWAPMPDSLAVDLAVLAYVAPARSGCTAVSDRPKNCLARDPPRRRQGRTHCPRRPAG